MLDFVAGLVGGLVRLLSSVLPDSPFASFADSIDTLRTGLGWLNFFVPVGDMMLIFGAWLAALLVWAAMHFVLTRALGTAQRLIGA